MTIVIWNQACKARISRRGFVGPSSHEGWLWEGKLREYKNFKSLTMPLMKSLHHEYVQLSRSNLILPIHSRMGVTMMLAGNYYTSLLLHAVHVTLWTVAAKLLQ